MSQKAEHNCRQLLLLVVLMLGLVCAILFGGIWSRTATVESYQSFNVYHSVHTTFTRKSVRELATQSLLLAQQKQKEIAEQIAAEEAKKPAMTPQELYLSYATEICTDYYPDVNPLYVAAIIYHESRFQPDAVNAKSGTTGLMQVSPKWHTKRAANLGVTDLKDPYGNILVGCDILHELAQKESFDYAMNFFAGGYPYANRYRNSASPYIASLQEIIVEQGFHIAGGD